ncbi:MAG: hypothetical protein R3286_17105, partial [Gammaproteobacteria bacterium]|nr:hypothetical protein [Gammaproteobacteria bacterium]
MRTLRTVCALALIPVVMAGCASAEKEAEKSYGKVPGFGDLTLCVVGGAVAGGTAGALVGEVVGGVMGVLAGAVMGDVL